jgi:secondary thiamine-phosphate synthase enzyme
MYWQQTEIRLEARRRGFHLITREIVSALAALPDLARVRVGFVQLFLQHTSASLTINENADPDVRADLARWLDRAVPENAPYFEHTAEGPDDMPAHVKAMVTGVSLQVPIVNGKLALGTWQTIYLVEHRLRPHRREVVLQFVGSCR